MMFCTKKTFDGTEYMVDIITRQVGSYGEFEVKLNDTHVAKVWYHHEGRGSKAKCFIDRIDVSNVELPAETAIKYVLDHTPAYAGYIIASNARSFAL